MNLARGAAVADLVRHGRFDEALVELYAQAERSPDDRSIRAAIEEVRGQMANALLDELGPTEAVPRLTGDPTRASLGPDERYLLSRLDGERTLGELLLISTLGRHRTVRVLSWLVKRALVHIPPLTSMRPTAPVSSSALERVLVADANATQASLARTMLRVSLGRAVQFESAQDSTELLALASVHVPDLVVIDFRLPGVGDGIEALRALRAIASLAQVPAIVLVQRIELDFAAARLPVRAQVLSRPLERDTLRAAIDRLVPGAAPRGAQHG